MKETVVLRHKKRTGVNKFVRCGKDEADIYEIVIIKPSTEGDKDVSIYAFLSKEVAKEFLYREREAIKKRRLGK
jgi:hypothetical protein